MIFGQIMLDEQVKLLDRFERRITQLIALCDTLRINNARLKDEIQQRDKWIEEARDRFRALEIKYDNLRAARSIANSDSEGSEQARLRLSKLVREVDKCIALLNE